MSVFNDEVISAIKKNLTRFETMRSAIIPILSSIHEEYGHVSEAQVEELEKTYGLPKVQVQEVITFYSRFRQSKPNRFHVQFCDNIVCRMFDSEKLIAQLQSPQYAQELTVEPVPCLGVCDGAPAMLVNDQRHLRVNTQNLAEIIDSYLKNSTGASLASKQ